MSNTKIYLEKLFSQYNIPVDKNRMTLLDEFNKDKTVISAFNQIQVNQNTIIEMWKLKIKINDVHDKQIIIPNATVNKPYEASIDFAKLGLNDLIYTQFDGLEQYGLSYDNETEKISGTPILSGDYKIKFKFRVSGEAEDSHLNEKQVSLVINADPKSLWKNIASDENKDDEWKLKNYWKPDNVTEFQPLGDRHIVVSSKRGRSHANVGSFRDDDYAFRHFESTGWSVVAVSDGAGSSQKSRQGSKIACDGVIEFFANNFNEADLKEFDELLSNYAQGIGEETAKHISHFVYSNLSKAALHAHRRIEEFAIKAELQLRDFHSTLIFALIKKYPFGNAILTFGVGDCPIGLVNRDMSEVKLMNWLDVGEFGGGTRFITMPEIFNSDKFTSRFGFRLTDDFSYLVLMTDGIYDPKFVVENNLERIEKWREFFDDLGGNNEEKIKVVLDPANPDISSQLSSWMDFWSPGNHDDRTLAIVF